MIFSGEVHPFRYVLPLLGREKQRYLRFSYSVTVIKSPRTLPLHRHLPESQSARFQHRLLLR